MIRSTLGFIFTPQFDQVLLIEKQRPAHHKGKLNGLGGKCAEGETSLDCIIREVKEESGLEITGWAEIGNMAWNEWNVDIFAAVYQGTKEDVLSLTSDEVKWYPTDQLPKNVLTNLPWLIPLAVDHLTNKIPPSVKITYPQT